MQSVDKQNQQPLKIWDKIQIVVGDDGKAGEYAARVEDFINGGIVITAPEFIRGGTRLRDRADVLVRFTRDDAAYQFSARIKKQNLQGRDSMLLTPPTRIKRIQRRFFVRIETSGPVKYAEIKPSMEWEDWQDKITWVETRSVDISGGGVLVITPEPVRDATLLAMDIAFLKDHQVPEQVIGIVRRTFTKDDIRFAGVEFVLKERLTEFVPGPELKKLPNEFKRFDKRAQERLVSEVFNEQIAMRRKGLL